MRRFEFVEGSSSKFWEVEVAGDALTVRYGRIGTAGQTQTKTFANAAKTQAEHDKLVREKTGKGYVEVGVDDAAALAPVAVRVTAAKAVAAAGGPGVAAEATDAATASPDVSAPRAAEPDANAAPAIDPLAAPGSEPQPLGQFLWTPHWRKLLPVLRGVEAHSLPPLRVEECLAELHRRAESIRSKLGRTVDRAAQQLLTAIGLDPGDAEFAISSTLTRSPPDGEAWRDLFRRTLATAQVSYSDVETPQLQTVWRLAAAAHGLRFALEQVLDAIQSARHNGVHYWALSHGGGLDELRARIAVAPADEYADLLASAHARARSSGLLATLVAHLLPTEADLVDAALAQLQSPQSGHAPEIAWVMASRLTAEQASQLIDALGRANWVAFESLRIGALNLAREKLPGAVDLCLRMLGVGYSNAEQRRTLFEIVRAHDTPEALAALLARLDDKDARPIADAFARQWPQLAIRLAAEQIVATGSKTGREWLGRFASAYPQALDAARGRADGVIRGVLDNIAAKQQTVGPEAGLGDLPDWLRAPPWRARLRAAAPTWPRIVPHDIVACMAWTEGERARWQNGRSPDTIKPSDWHHDLHGLSGDKLLRRALGVLGVRDAAHARALAGQRLGDADMQDERWSQPPCLMVLPAVAARAVLEAKNPRQWSEWGDIRLEFVVAWLDGLAPTALEAFAERAAERGLQLALPLASARIANVAANALRTSKKAKPAAQAWLLRHAQLAADALLPQLAERSRGEDAGYALRWLLANGRAAAAEAAADGYGADGRAALATLAAFDPMNLAPPKIPKLPAFWLPAAYGRLQLGDGRSMPLGLIDAVGEMLAFSPLEQRYAGLDRLRELCTLQSLGAFAWDLFQSWLTAGAPSKESWAFTALAHLGDDECARKLALLIRAWPGEAAHARAVTGLDVLAAIGSDVALMHLNGIAQKVKFKGLQEKARAKIDQMAQARGLSAEELADRLVPDLGLDEHGTLTLDFGPRQFTVGFDETLKPFARDASGAPLKDLPKPIRSDDATLAGEASERWKALKKDARTLASQQILRLELAMAQRRRWSAVEFRRFFVEHPLLRHLARRLLWARFQDGQPVQCLRVAEDLSYADANDDLLTLPDAAEIGLVHALELASADAAAFGQIFADYEILQPFAQLGREVYRLSADERDAFELARFKGKQVATGSVFGLENRGWRRGDPQDGGWIGWFTRPISDDLEVELDLDPGTVVGEINYEPKQKLGALVLRRPNSYSDDGRRRWKDIDPILASEVLRDIDRLATVG